MTSLLSKIGLGTAQWGLTYGISNHSGQTKPEEVSRILSYARAMGIKVIDTARVYGEAEQVLGLNDLSHFNIITKIPALEIWNRDHCFLSASVKDSLSRSLHALHVESLQGLLLHNCDDLFSEFGSKIVASLQELKASGKVIQIGVSVYSSLQIKRVLDIFKPDIIQLPYNVFDQRLLEDGTLSALKSDGIEIHARSIFLQGLLLMKHDSIPKYFTPWKDKFVAWNRLCADLGSHPMHAALSFAASNNLIDKLIIGVESLSQLEQLTALKPHINNSFLFNKLSSSDEKLLNPSLWLLQN